jgi:hypothetical protein
MTEAIFGLVGVLVGSAITWGIEVWRARRTGSDEARVAARLVADELQSLDNVRTVDLPQFVRQRDLALEQDAWLQQRAVLARELTDERWRAVRAAYDALAIPLSGGRQEESIQRSYSEAISALEPLMSSSRRDWWHRLRSRLGGGRGREPQGS